MTSFPVRPSTRVGGKAAAGSAWLTWITSARAPPRTRTEATAAESGKKAAMGGGLLGAGGVVAVLGCFWLIGAAVYALALALPLWASALIIGAVVTAAGALLAWAGAERMKKLKPEQTMKNLEEDQRWLKGTLQQALAQRRGSASA